MIFTTLYLPLVRDCIKVLSCDTAYIAPYYTEVEVSFWDSEYKLDNSVCYTSYDGHIGYCILAGFCILFYILPAPYCLYKLIKHHKPKPVFFDASGQTKTKGFTNQDYENELKKQRRNPYKSLYSGYKRDWVKFKFTLIWNKKNQITSVIV